VTAKVVSPAERNALASTAARALVTNPPSALKTNTTAVSGSTADPADGLRTTPRTIKRLPSRSCPSATSSSGAGATGATLRLSPVAAAGGAVAVGGVAAGRPRRSDAPSASAAIAPMTPATTSNRPAPPSRGSVANIWPAARPESPAPSGRSLSQRCSGRGWGTAVRRGGSARRPISARRSTLPVPVPATAGAWISADSAAIRASDRRRSAAANRHAITLMIAATAIDDTVTINRNIIATGTPPRPRRSHPPASRGGVPA